MADEKQTPAAGATAEDLGGTNRVVTGQGGEENISLEEQDRRQQEAAGGGQGSAEGQGASEGAAEGGGEAGGNEAEEGSEGEGAGKPGPVDLTGTVFEGLSPEMQGKIAPFAAAYSANGTLTDAEVAEAATATGFSEAAVRQFMAGAEATAGAQVAPVMEAFGGQANFSEFQTWTREEGNLTAAEAKTINKALGIGADGKPDSKLTPDFEMAAQLMAAPMERWKAAGGGAAPRDVTRNPGGGGGNEGDVYANYAQVQEDMNNPKYRKDEAFRKQVEAKIARSPNL